MQGEAQVARVYLPAEGAYLPAMRLAERAETMVLALNCESWRLEPQTLRAARLQGIGPGWIVETRLGRRLPASSGTRLLTIAGWRAIEELAPGAAVAVPRRLPGPDAQTLEKKHLELAAYLLADCWRIDGATLRYTAADAQEAQRFAALVRRVFGGGARPWCGEGAQQVELVVNEAATSWLDAMGLLRCPPAERRIPAQVLAQPLRGVKHFLRRLWASAGTLALHRGHAPHVYYRSPSPWVVLRLQSLLLRLEINAVAMRTLGEQRGRGAGATEPEAAGHLLHISGKQDLKRFLKAMLQLNEQQERSLPALREYLAGHTGVSSRDLLPRDTWEAIVVPALRAAGVTEAQIRAVLGYPPFGASEATHQLSRGRAAQIAPLVRSEVLAALAQSDVYWDEIAALLPATVASCALEMEGVDNLVADDIIISRQ